MSDTPRKLLRLPMGSHRGYSLAVLGLLWDCVSVVRKRGGGPHWVYYTLARLSEDLDVGQRQISQGITGLATAGLVRGEYHEGQYGYWLMTPAGLEDPQQPPDRSPDDPAIGDRVGGDRRTQDLEVGARRGDRRSNSREIVDREGRDRRSTAGRSSIAKAEIVDRNSGDRRSEFGRSSIEIRGCKEEKLATQLATQLTTAQLASVPNPLVAKAQALLVELCAVCAPRGPDGQLVVGPAKPQAVTLLATLLDVPEQGDSRAQALVDREAFVRRVLFTYASICAADPGPDGEGRWWTPLMFSLVPIGPGKPGMPRKAPWEVVVGKVVEHDTRAAQQAAAQRAAAEEAERVRRRVAEQAEEDRRDAAARASWTPERFAEHLRGQSYAPVTVRNQPAPPSTPLLSRDELLERKQRLSDAIREASDAGERQKALELSQARLELSRQLLVLDQQPFGAEAPGSHT